MPRCLAVTLICAAAIAAVGQAPSSNFQPGTIMAVTAHKSPGQTDTDVTQYDVSVRVGDTLYMVLYAPPGGSNTVKFAAGVGILVLVGSDTLTFNNAASEKTVVPILSRETLTAEKLDWTKVCGQYFTLKLQHLSEKLALTDSQQAEIKPVLQQEAGEVGEICFNPALSKNDTLNQYEKILMTSDGKIKPLLSASQVEKLQDLRKEQKQNVRKMITEQKSGKQN
jgi:hypothetical protein